MHKRYIALGLLLLLFISTISPISTGFEHNQHHIGETIYVGGSGPGNHSTIQDAIDEASDGTKIFVYNGIYFENLKINSKSLILQGEQKEKTIIDAGDAESALILQNADDCSVSGFTFRNLSGLVWFEAGVLIDACNDCSITDNIFCNCGHGIWLYKSEDIQIQDNNLVDNLEGIVFYDTNAITIERNNIENNSVVGLYFNGCKTASIVENNFIDNARHLTLFGIIDVDVDLNYWDNLNQWKIKLLLWTPFNIIPLPVLTFDWHPAKEPYDIMIN